MEPRRRFFRASSIGAMMKEATSVRNFDRGGRGEPAYQLVGMRLAMLAEQAPRFGLESSDCACDDCLVSTSGEGAEGSCDELNGQIQGCVGDTIADSGNSRDVD